MHSSQAIPQAQRGMTQTHTSSTVLSHFGYLFGSAPLIMSKTQALHTMISDSRMSWEKLAQPVNILFHEEGADNKQSTGIKGIAD